MNVYGACIFISVVVTVWWSVILNYMILIDIYLRA